jgi:adenylate cyclase
MLNLYFEALAGAVMRQGGEVLKFIGDGMLAVFPVGDDPAAAARAALAAAAGAFASVGALNIGAERSLAAALPLRSGVALHLGDLFYGNVGAPERLDFTVIGRAVNEAARVEALTKSLGRDLLLTEPVAALVDAPLEDLGEHALKGVEAPLRLFAPAP